MEEKQKPSLKKHSEIIENPIEVTLRQFLQPVKPRNEFVEKLRGKLTADVLPIQKKKAISFYTLFEIFFQTIALLLITILTVRMLMIIITSWKFIRASSLR